MQSETSGTRTTRQLFAVPVFVASTCVVLLGLQFANGSAAQEPAEGEAKDAPAEVVADTPTVDINVDEGAFGDYEASEQISEDLSVSFPVDI